MEKIHPDITFWTTLLCGPVFSLISLFFAPIILSTVFDLQSDLAGQYAFYLSVFILVACGYIFTFVEMRKTKDHSKGTREDVKDHLDIIKIGTPAVAWAYIIERLPMIKTVQNTSFNWNDETGRSNPYFYKRDEYCNSLDKIAASINSGLIWRDIGDKNASNRFNAIKENVCERAKGEYEYAFIDLCLPVVSFIVLTDKESNNEVLFNWDFQKQNEAQEPIVLLSRDNEIVDMFISLFNNLKSESVLDYESIETRSTS